MSCLKHGVILTDEEDEPILGQWMEEIMSPSEGKDSSPPPSLPPRHDGESSGGKRSRKTSTGDGNNLVPDKREDSVQNYFLVVLPSIENAGQSVVRLDAISLCSIQIFAVKNIDDGLGS